jgi:large subunit ribosomal protein L7A
MESDKTMRVTGFRQVIRALDSGTLISAQLAQDCDASMMEKLLAAFEGAGVPYQLIPTRDELGKLCGINVGAAVAGIVKTV